MRLSPLTISKISEFVTGDNRLGPYRTGRELTELFNEVGVLDVYQYGNGGLPDSMSRSVYTKDRLSTINDSDKLAKIITLVFDARLFAATEFDFENCITEANKILAHDALSLDISTGKTRISGYEPHDEISVKAVFENIENNILEEITKARFSIWVAVGWFTNKNI